MIEQLSLSHESSPAADGADPVASAFSSVDWAFANSKSTPPHDIHPYPARFIPEIPSAALNLIRDIPGPILDPFCGSGTTIVEAIRVGRQAVGIDLNPIATLITRVKARRWTAGDEEELTRYVTELAWAVRQTGAKRSDVPRVDHWFDPLSQEILGSATAYLAQIADPIWSDRVAVAISAAVVRLSRQDSDTRYAAVSKRTSEDKAFGAIPSALEKVAAQLRAFAPFHGGTTTTVITGNASDVECHIQRGSMAAAIFSPPYPNAYEYWLYHKYRMFWLGYDPVAIREREWGARPHYSGSGSSSIETFAGQMGPVMESVAEALSPGGVCLVVVGDSQIKGVVHDNRALFIRLGVGAGLHFAASALRPLRESRKSFNLAVARAKTEHVLLFRKP